MTPELENDIRDLLLRCIREREEEWLAIEAESLLKRMKEEEPARALLCGCWPGYYRCMMHR